MAGVDGKPLSEEDVAFLRWVADWLDRIDPILRAVFAKTGTLTEDEHERIEAFLSGTEVQERLRLIAGSA